MIKRLTTKQARFVKSIVKGNNIGDSVRMAGYNVDKNNTASVIGNQLLKKDLIRQALDQEGLTDTALATTLKQTIEAGIGVKASNSDSISGLRLAFELKGALAKDTPDNLQQNNIYINELKQLDDSQLSNKIDELTQAIHTLKDNTEL